MKAFLTAALVVLLASAASAQFKKGDVEMMLLGTVGTHTETTKFTINGPPKVETESDESSSYAYVSFLPAYYFVDGLAAELELGLRASEGGRPTQTVILHLAYTQPFGRIPIALFARAGFGMSNGFSTPVYFEQVHATNDFDISIINLGVGAKFMFSNTALLRAEINYRMQSYTNDSAFGTSELSRNTLALLFGLGVVL